MAEKPFDSIDFEAISGDELPRKIGISIRISDGRKVSDFVKNIVAPDLRILADAIDAGVTGNAASEERQAFVAVDDDDVLVEYKIEALDISPDFFDEGDYIPDPSVEIDANVIGTLTAEEKEAAGV